MFLLLSAALALIYNRAVDIDKFAAAFALLTGATVAGLVSVATDSLAFHHLLPLGGWENWVLVINHLAATALLGSVMLTMIFGHWYLVIPRLSIDHLVLLTKVLIASIAVRVLTIVVSLAVLRIEQTIPLTAVLRELMVSQGIFFW